MSAEHTPRNPGRRRVTSLQRSLRLAVATGTVALAWFMLAATASSADPSASPSVNPSDSPSAPAVVLTPSPSPAATAGASQDSFFATPGPSWSPNWSPGPSESMDPLFIPTPGPSAPPLASAPPVPTPIAHIDGKGKNSCYDCHSAVNDKQAGIAADWSSSAHQAAGVTCADCHGGDPTSDQITVAMDPARGFVGAPSRFQTVGRCGSCHADPNRMKPYNLATDEYAKYWTSVHGQRLLTTQDERVAICTDCHGTHAIKKTSDPTAKVFPLNVPDLCASCHADAKRMKPYGIPTDQFDIYSKSVHGIALLINKDVRAPTCASCHGSHDAQPPTSATVVDVCGKCHTTTQALYEESRHSQLPAATPKCWTCHGTHDVSQPSSAIFFHELTPNYTCVTCHDLQTHKLRLEMAKFDNVADRKCDTCHHPDSDIYAQIQGISSAVTGAETAYREADAQIRQASALGMITSDAELALAGAKTSLIQAQAAVHTTKLATVAQLSGDAKGKADAAKALATSKVDESTFRREAMVAVLALITVCIVFLVALKRRLDRDLEHMS
jgi:hypothetical protein